MDLKRNSWTASRATPQTDRHTIHTYYTTCPESPDGKWLLYYTSGTADGHHGDLRILDRESGQETIIAEGLETEDAHRVACQQWVSGGRRVVWQNLAGGKWHIEVYDLESGRSKTIAENLQLGFGQAYEDLIPVAGLHWDAGSMRDMAVLDVETGRTAQRVPAQEVRDRFPDWVRPTFGNSPLSLCAGVLSPDAKRIFLKAAAPGGGDWRSAGASVRAGLLVYDLERRQFLCQLEKWGHPAWMPDSRRILNVRGAVIDSEDGSEVYLQNWPHICASHPSASADGKEFVTDAGWFHHEDPHIWQIWVGDLKDGTAKPVYEFADGGGATSWRPPHAHPVFSADGQRIYFNALDKPWTELQVLERGQ